MMMIRSVDCPPKGSGIVFTRLLLGQRPKGDIVSKGTTDPISMCLQLTCNCPRQHRRGQEVFPSLSHRDIGRSRHRMGLLASICGDTRYGAQLVELGQLFNPVPLFDALCRFFRETVPRAVPACLPLVPGSHQLKPDRRIALKNPSCSLGPD
jgi:hypothetical protein